MNKNRGGSVIKVLLALALISIAVFTVYHSDRFQKEYLYPYPYRDYIERYAKLNAIDPLLVVSIMKAESKFDPTANSDVGAIGLMQLMPESGRWIAEEIGEPLGSASQLENPQISIKLGSWYIASLIDENNGNLVLALAAYNAGRGNVNYWVKEKAWPDNFSDYDRIPFKETSVFVKRVLANYENYKHLYQSENKL
ncbi:MAG: lytic transglycosylase domain-containing protein [Bacillota bacterium]